ncbi:MAG: PEGA domain-containing protein [Deltaproteobacteria bacterium]|nr:PEGA domain-containing protein [Deltaproteobacteria bacterium]
MKRNDVGYFDIDLDALPPIIELTSTPSGALVTVNDVPRGTTPTSVTGLEATQHKIRLIRPGCAPFLKSVHLRQGEVQSIHGELQCGETR